MEIERIALFINRLSEKSKAGGLGWVVETSNSFSATLGQYKVSIAEIYEDGDDPQYSDPDYYVGIYNQGQGDWIDGINDGELKDALPNSFKVMQGIYRSARRTANGFGKAIDDLLGALDDEL